MFPRDAPRSGIRTRKIFQLAPSRVTKNSRFKHALQQMSKAVSGQGKKQNNREGQLCPSKHQKLTLCIWVFWGKPGTQLSAISLQLKPAIFRTKRIPS